jgi:nitric oxide reductase NorD protein
VPSLPDNTREHMIDAAPLSTEEIASRLEAWLEVEFTFYKVGELAAAYAQFSREEQDFMLDWIRRIATTNIEVAWQFGLRTTQVANSMDRRVLEAWALHAMDNYDRAGLRAALSVVREADDFAQGAHERAAGAAFEDVGGILLTFVRGLSGRHLKLAQADGAYTDTETLFLPAVVARMQTAEDNFRLCKAMVAVLWAQTRFGTFRVNLEEAASAYPDSDRALRQLHALETLRLEACLSIELPGLYREMRRLKAELGEDELPEAWKSCATQLARPDASVHDSLRLLAQIYPGPVPHPVCYQGELRADAVAECMEARVEREKMLLRVRLAQLAEEPKRQQAEAPAAPPRFEVSQNDEPGSNYLEITLNDIPISPPDDVQQLLASIQLDLGEIPPEYLSPAGPGEYDTSLFEEKTKNPDEVWQGTYHEEGATLYPEWDFGRQHYRKNWCVMREKDVVPVYDDFAAQTLQKYSGLVKHLRKTFEAMRDEDRLLKRQVYGDDVDIDALVEALADAHDGREMSDRLFTRMHRTERNIAVVFMVDMSGSTKGWINDAERESLVLLCETLETLGDRYAIYGFSGTTRKRCEIYRIKQIDEPYDEEVHARISGIRPQDYTRMGFAIRHLSQLLNGVEARTKLLITLSDGKPDDYFDGYRGKYGIEDTRKALQEAQRSGIHPFCITIDQEARDYLPHMYGAANWVLVDEVRQLPLKVADIYRKLTT